MFHPNPSPCSQPSTLSNNHANTILTSTWFVNLYSFKPLEDTSLPSKLELLFLLDNVAPIRVLNLLTFTLLADHFLKCSKFTPQNNDFITLTVAEVPILFIMILALHSFIHGSTPTLVIPFAVANIKYNILRTTFFENYVKTLKIRIISLSFNTPQ